MTRLARFAIALVGAAATLVALPALSAAQTGAVPGDDTAGISAFDAQGMWVWYVSRSHGGRARKIIRRARRSRVGTVYVKSGDASNYWNQFSRSLVSRLHAGGLKVCAWQFVYGDSPYREARVGAAAVKRGADCLIIDAEGHYEGKYAAADRYIRKLRSRIGADFPLALASFPYVDYHPGFPYSVFLGPEGAQYNQPQMYWKTIGTSIPRVYSHTYRYNRVYGRPIHPIGQTYLRPGLRGIKRFRRYALSYGAGGVSWWSWQETSGREWRVLRRRVRRVRGLRPGFRTPLLKRGSRGDLVVWAQQHLVAAGQSQLPVTGLFKRQTYNAVLAFQQQKGLWADGVIGTATWSKLLEYAPVRIEWGARHRRRGRAAASRSGAGRA
ncbi:MAG: peptidoglycan-binding domain-containing protein, partial [Solirubrobacterales bacterium]